jgi:predicted ABC-type transport system involved in lysophospholipase L1 biosynthesis ATPase subunit
LGLQSTIGCEGLPPADTDFSSVEEGARCGHGRARDMGIENHLKAIQLRRSFQIGPRKVDVLRGIDLEINRGEVVFLCGASGAGKTTLLYTLAGLEKPESGSVLIDGETLYAKGDGAECVRRNRKIGFVFQGYFLLPELTALENVALPAMIGGNFGSGAKRRAQEGLERVGLADRLHHLPAELSGGEQQRVAIARSLMNDPSLLFADEPTGNLDSKTGATIIELLLALTREKQRTLVVVTHDANLAKQGDRRLEIRDGQLVH